MPNGESSDRIEARIEEDDLLKISSKEELKKALIDGFERDGTFRKDSPNSWTGNVMRSVEGMAIDELLEQLWDRREQLLKEKEND